MTYELESQVISTPAGDYVVRWIYDEFQERPYDEGFGLVMVRDNSDRIDISQGENASEVANLVSYHRLANAYNGNIYDSEIRSSAAIARYLRLKYGMVGIVVVDDDYHGSQPSSDRGESFTGLAWAPSDATYPDQYTRGMLAEWRAWAEGDTFGWTVEDPEGNEIDSCWGYYGLDAQREDTLGEAREAINYDVAKRTKHVATVGAGFIGLI
jgi:hypothetical protein